MKQHKQSKHQVWSVLITGIQTILEKQIHFADSQPFVLLNAGILKDGKSLEVLFFGLSGEMGADPFTIGPVVDRYATLREFKWFGLLTI